MTSPSTPRSGSASRTRTPGRDAQVFLTGATGFVGKVVLAELMRRRRELGLETVWVLIRARKGKTAQERFEQEISGAGCFALLTDDWRKHCRVIDGELSHESCGISAADQATLTGTLTHIVHCAASVEFDLPIADAAAANITSALNVLELARRCSRLAHMVSVSTAYVTPHRSDTTPILEDLAPMPRAPAAVYRAILEGTANEKEFLAETGHPNTYTFTKCVAEHLLVERRGHVPLTIVRPSIISACWRQPFPGWLDSAAAFAGFVALIGAGYLKAVVADRGARLDVVPCDSVADRIIGSALVDAPPSEPRIRYAVAGLPNNCRVDTCLDIITDYFRRHPVDRVAGIVHVGPPSHAFRLQSFRHHEVPTRLARTWFAATRQKKLLKSASRLGERITYLNRAFPYFTHKTFDFRSALPVLDASFRREAYVELVCRGVYRHLMKRDETEMSLAGRKHKDAVPSDIAFGLLQPDGNWAIRTFAVAVRKALRQCTSQVTFDRPSFENAVRTAGQRGAGQANASKSAPRHRFVIIPTHRSYMDFLLCSYLFFARRDLGIDIPHIAAAEEFSRIPILGELFKKTQAFYLKRGTGRPDPELTRHVHDLVQGGETLQFFIEGQRSRSRQFLPPRTGLLRCLQNTGETFTLLPVALSYDRVPEEASLLRELRGEAKGQMQLRGLLAWTARMARGEVSLGRVHLVCGTPVTMGPDSDVRETSREVMAQLQAYTATTTHHLRSFLQQTALDVDVAWLREAIVRRGGQVIDSPLGGEESVDAVSEQCMRYNWMHWFYGDARTVWPEHPAIAHHLKHNDYLALDRTPATSGSPACSTELRDPRLRQVLRALFEPISRDYGRVAERLGSPDWSPRHASPRSVLVELPDAHLPFVQAVFQDLVDRGVLSASSGTGAAGTTHAWGPNAADIEAYKAACAWPDGLDEDDALLADAAAAGAVRGKPGSWRHAVGA